MLPKTPQRSVATNRAARSSRAREILRKLGHDPSNPDWERALLDLVFLTGHSDGWGKASLHFRGRGKWDHDSQMLLIREVSLLTRNGVSERRAFKQLALDPKKLALFPYAEQVGRREPRSNCQSRAAEALRQELQRIKRSASDPLRTMLQNHLTGKSVSITLDRAAEEAEHRRKGRAGENGTASEFHQIGEN